MGGELSSDDQNGQPSEEGADAEGPETTASRPKKRKLAPMRYEPNDSKRHNVILQAIHAIQRGAMQQRIRGGCSVLAVVVTPENDIYSQGSLDLCGILDCSATGFQDMILGFVQASRGAVRVLQGSGQLEKMAFKDLNSHTRATLLDVGMTQAVPNQRKLFPYENSDASLLSQPHPWFPSSLPYKPSAELSLSEQQELFRALCGQLTVPGYKAAADGSSKWGSYVDAVKAKAAINNQSRPAGPLGGKLVRNDRLVEGAAQQQSKAAEAPSAAAEASQGSGEFARRARHKPYS